MDISNWLTLLGVIIAITTHLLIVSAKISKFMGTTEECLRSINRRVDEMQETHASCFLKERIKIVEEKQGDLRDELPERLARIEQDLKELNRRFGELKEDMREHLNRTGKKDRLSDT